MHAVIVHNGFDAEIHCAQAPVYTKVHWYKQNVFREDVNLGIVKGRLAIFF